MLKSAFNFFVNQILIPVVWLLLGVFAFQFAFNLVMQLLDSNFFITAKQSTAFIVSLISLKFILFFLFDSNSKVEEENRNLNMALQGMVRIMATIVAVNGGEIRVTPNDYEKYNDYELTHHTDFTSNQEVFVAKEK